MRLENKKIIALVDNDFEDLELWYPVHRLREEGAQVDLVGEEAHKTYIGKYGVPAESAFAFSDIHADDYDAILVPGGWAPDKLRRFPEVISFVQTMDKDKKIIGQICHAGWVLISANILQGKTVTSTPGIKDDMTNLLSLIDKSDSQIYHTYSSYTKADQDVQYWKKLCKKALLKLFT